MRLRMNRLAAWMQRRWRLLVGLGLLLVLVLVVDPRALLRAAADAQPGWLALGLACAVAANLVSALRWWALARWLGADVAPGWAIARYFGGVALNAMLPGAVVGGDVYRAHALVRSGLPWGMAGASVLADRLGGLWVLVAMGLIGVSVGLASADGAALHEFRLSPFSVTIAVLILVSVALLMMLGPVVMVWSMGVSRARSGARVDLADDGTASAAPHGRLRHLKGTVRGLAALARRPGARVQLLLQLGLSVVVQAGSIATLDCAGAALGLSLAGWVWVSAAVPVFVMAALPVSFGGWGSREAAAIVALGMFGVPAPLALGVGLLYGLAALAQAVPGALLLLAERRDTAMR
jgi:glycosyltransferase 2 family protein